MNEPRLNVNALALESALMLRRAHMMLVPSLMASTMSFFVALSMSASLDPELLKDFETLVSSGEVNRILLIGSAVYAVLISLAHGVTTAMANELLDKGSTSLNTAAEFAARRMLPLVAMSLILGLSTVVGLAVLLFPGLFITLFLMYAMASLVVDGADPLGAVQRSFRTVADNFRESFWLFITFAASYFLMNIILMALVFLPFLGVLAAFFLTSGYMATLSIAMTKAYRILSVPESPSYPDEE